MRHYFREACRNNEDSRLVTRRLTDSPVKGCAFPTAARPTETYDQRRKYMYLNHEGIEEPAAHSDGDSEDEIAALNRLVAVYESLRLRARFQLDS